jgi:Rrf2 family protein
VAFYTARVEYALHTVLNLLRAGPQSSPSARELADFQRLPVAFTRRLLSQLERAGIMAGTEGVGGGWRLARPAEELTVLDVADAAQGDEPLFDCREIRRHCALWDDDEPPASTLRGVCSIHAVMLRAEAAMRHELAGTTIADLAAQVGAKTGPDAASAVPVWFATEYSRRRSAGGPAARHRTGEPRGVDE